MYFLPPFTRLSRIPRGELSTRIFIVYLQVINSIYFICLMNIGEISYCETERKFKNSIPSILSLAS